MPKQPTTVDEYLAIGCGRCPLGGTPDCKVHNFEPELKALRAILLESNLSEEIKWSVPCYTYNGANVLLLSAFKDYCCLSFFKGALMNDPHNILIQPTANTQASRLIRFEQGDAQKITRMADTLQVYILDAIRVEDTGLEYSYKSTEQYEMPDELLSKFEDDPQFQAAFEALTPGRQRGYLLHFSSAKKSETRIRRIEKYMSNIFEGIGLHDRY
ncbi:MAG: YdeI/OmpD-associated family protein [Chloroflexota bacterium]